MSEYKPGDIVDITIKGVRVDAIANDLVHVVMPNGATASVELSNYDGVTIDYVAPIEWPPCAGDLWKYRFGVVFIHKVSTGGLAAITRDGGALCNFTPQNFGPVTLLHREEADR